ncbi:MAG: hypothetical protein ABWY52_03370 [Candidatus Limnocylindrales bacterium]
MNRQAPVEVLVGVLIVAVGIVWIGQGLGFLPGSFMSGDPFWAAAGGVALVIGSVLVVRGLRSRPR